MYEFYENMMSATKVEMLTFFLFNGAFMCIGMLLGYWQYRRAYAYKFRMLKPFWYLTITPEGEEVSRSRLCARTIVVRAKNPTEAREVAHLNYCQQHPKPFWTNTKLTSCTWLDASGPSQAVIEDGTRVTY